jgi:hypothetical protein
MRLEKDLMFPFAEFDPVLRRNLNAVFAAARRDLERASQATIRDRFALRDRLVRFLKESALEGERDPLRLYDNAMRSCGGPISSERRRSA